MPASEFVIETDPRKRGFKTLATVHDYPRGHQNLLLSKRLGEAG
jgi:hypothetical protein